MVLPDLPLHGDSEDRPRHPYSPDWLADVIAGFCREVGRAALDRRRSRPRGRAGAARGQHRAARARAPGADAQPAAPPRRVRGQARGLARRLPGGGASRAWIASWPTAPASSFGPRWGRGSRSRATRPRGIWFVTPSPTSAATATAPARGRSSPAAGRSKPSASCSTPTRRCACRPCSCGPTRIPRTRSLAAREALDLLPDAQLRTLPGTGFLIAYDDPVAVARELIAFCG